MGSKNANLQIVEILKVVRRGYYSIKPKCAKLGFLFQSKTVELLYHEK